MEKSLFADNVPVAVYENLIKAVDENADKLHRYIALRKKALKYDELHMYDLSVPIVDGASLSLSYEEAFELVIKGLAPLGKEYEGLLKQARDCGWIDVMETKESVAVLTAGDVTAFILTYCLTIRVRRMIYLLLLTS